ncbi:MAG: hypothetical protein ACRCST_04830 [Turicibacter sp.]
MKHYNPATLKQAQQQMNVEFGSDFGEMPVKTQRQQNHGDLPSSAAGGITRKLVEIGEQLMIHQGNKN